jgi:hypothetical protein
MTMSAPFGDALSVPKCRSCHRISKAHSHLHLRAVVLKIVRDVGPNIHKIACRVCRQQNALPTVSNSGSSANVVHICLSVLSQVGYNVIIGRAGQHAGLQET